MSLTVTVLIGNSDDRLPQVRWVEYVMALDQAVERVASTIHFRGFAAPDAPWQSACWVFEMPDDPVLVNAARWSLSDLASRYDQESVAWLQGVTQLLKATS